MLPEAVLWVIVPAMQQPLPALLLAFALGGCQFDVSNTSTLDDSDIIAADASATESPDAKLGAPDAEPVPQGTYLAYWSFDVDARDTTGAYDGTLVGGASITSGNFGFGSGEALQLDGNGARMDITNPRLFDFNSDFTWHAYIRTEDSSGAIFTRNPAGTDWNQGSKALFVRNNSVQWDSGWVSNPRTGVTVNDGAWHQVIATYTAADDTLNVFVDPTSGTAAGNYSGSHDVNRFDEHTHVHKDGLAESGFSLGAADFTGGLNDLNTLEGLIDEAAVWDRALAGEELDQLILNGPSQI